MNLPLLMLIITVNQGIKIAKRTTPQAYLIHSSEKSLLVDFPIT